MNRLNELIQELCPDGVEFKRLGELGVFENIGVDKKIIQGQSLVTLLNYVDVYKNMYIDNSIPKMVVSASIKKIHNCSCEKGDIFITPTSETKNDIGHASVIRETLINTVYSYHIMRFRLIEVNMISSFFIRYLFETEFVKKQIYKLSKGLTRGEFKQQVQIYSILFKKHSLGVENSSFFLGLLLISCIYRVIC